MCIVHIYDVIKCIRSMALFVVGLKGICRDMVEMFYFEINGEQP